jgi:putative transposase
MKWTYKYRIYPKKEQSEKLDRQLRLCKDLYNVALDQRRNSWEFSKEKISYRSQANELWDLNASLNIMKRIRTGSVELLKNASGVCTSTALCTESGKFG